MNLVLHKTGTIREDNARIKEQLGRAIPHSTSIQDEFDGLREGRTTPLGMKSVLRPAKYKKGDVDVMNPLNSPPQMITRSKNTLKKGQGKGGGARRGGNI